MRRVDLYSRIHKAQRAHLFALATKIGRADFSDQEEVSAIEKEVRDMMAHMREHSESEATFIHPLFQEIGEEIETIDEEHDDLEEELLELEDILERKEWERLYPEFNLFIANYLVHQDDEEELQADVLWEHFDDARLGEVMAAYKKSRTPQQLKDNLKFLLFGLSLPEIADMFQSMPVPAKEEAYQIAQQELEPERWEKLHAQIGEAR